MSKRPCLTCLGDGSIERPIRGNHYNDFDDVWEDEYVSEPCPNCKGTGYEPEPKVIGKANIRFKPGPIAVLPFPQSDDDDIALTDGE